MNIRDLSCAAFFLTGANPDAEGAVFAWDNGSGNSIWSVPGNWSPDGEPGVGDDVIFPSSRAGNIFLDSGESAKSLLFDQNYQLISGALTLAADATITTAAGRVAQISAPLSAPGTPVKNGPGTLVLNGANTMSGGIAVNAGTLRLSSAAAAGSSANGVKVASGASLELSNIIFQQQVSLADGAELAGEFSAAAYGRVSIAPGANTVVFSGRSTSGVLDIGNASNELTGGTATTVAYVNGPGTVRLNAPSNYAGNWQVNAGGKLELKNLAALGENAAGNVTLNGGTLSNKLLNGGVLTGPSNIILTDDGTFMSDEDERIVFPKVSMGSHTLHLTLGPGGGPLWPGIDVLEMRLTGDPVLDFANEAGCTLSVLKGGAVPRTITLTGLHRLHIDGGNVELAHGSRFVATGPGLVSGSFPPLASGARVIPAPGQNPLGQADFQGSGTLALYVPGLNSSEPQTVETGNNVEASGRLTLQLNSSDSGKTLQLGALTVANGGGLTLNSETYCNAAFAGPVSLRGDAVFGGTGSEPGKLTLGEMSEAEPATLTFEGPVGTVNLTGPCSRTGPVLVTGGEVNAMVTGALGNGPLTISGGRLNVSAAGGITTAVPVTVSSDGLLNLAHPAAAAGKTVNVTNGSLVLSNESSATFNLAGLNVSGDCHFHTTSGLASTFGQVISLNTPATVAANSRLQFESESAYVVTQRWLQPVQLNGDATITAGEVPLAAVSFAGGIGETTPSKMTFSLDGSYSFSVQLEGPGSWSGGTTVGRGAVVTVKTAGALGIGAVQINGPGVSNGTSTLVVAPGASLTGVAGVEVIEGVLEFQHTGAGASVPVTMRGGSLVLKADSAGTYTHGGIIFDGSRITITPARFSGGVTAPSVLTTLGSLTVRNNPVLVFTSGIPSNRLALGPVLMESDLTLETNGPAISTVGALSGTLPAFRESGGPRKIIKNGFLPLILNAPSTHSGGLETGGGMVVIQHPQGAGTGPILLDGPTAPPQLRVAGGITVTNAVTAKNGTIGAITGPPGTSGANTLAGPVNLTGAITLNNALASEFIVSGPVSGAFGITVTGTGVTRLTNAASSFGTGLAGSINVNGGVLEVVSNEALGNPGNGITLSGAAAKFRPLSSFSTARSFTLPSPSGSLEIPADVQLALQGPVSGAGTLTKSGAGTLVLASPATAGAGSVSGGILAINGGQLTVSGSFSVVGGATRVTVPVSAGASWSALTVGGGATISGGLVLDVTPGASLAVGSRIFLLNKTSTGAVNGTFSGLAEGASLTTASGHTFVITYGGGDGNDIVATLVSAPVPGDSEASVSSFTARAGTGVEAGLTVTDITAVGLPGVSYHLDESPDLQSWQIVQTTTAELANGSLVFRVTRSPVSRLYFRIRKTGP